MPSCVRTVPFHRFRHQNSILFPQRNGVPWGVSRTGNQKLYKILALIFSKVNKRNLLKKKAILFLTQMLFFVVKQLDRCSLVDLIMSHVRISSGQHMLGYTAERPVLTASSWGSHQGGHDKLGGGSFLSVTPPQPQIRQIMYVSAAGRTQS